MQSAISNIETFIAKAGELAETKTEILKLKAAGKISDTVSALIAVIAIVLCMSIAVIIGSIGAAFWIGNSLGHTSHGFFIVGGFYLFAGFIIWLFRKSWIKEPLSNLITRKIIK